MIVVTATQEKQLIQNPFPSLLFSYTLFLFLQDGLTPVMTAAMATRLEMVEFLLQKNPDVKLTSKV